MTGYFSGFPLVYIANHWCEMKLAYVAKIFLVVLMWHRCLGTPLLHYFRMWFPWVELLNRLPMHSMLRRIIIG